MTPLPLRILIWTLVALGYVIVNVGEVFDKLRARRTSA